MGETPGLSCQLMPVFPQEVSPTSASPSLDSAHTWTPSNLKRFTDHTSSSLQALDKSLGSHQSPGYLGEGEKKKEKRKHKLS